MTGSSGYTHRGEAALMSIKLEISPDFDVRIENIKHCYNVRRYDYA